MTRRILITGSRDWTDQFRIMNEIQNEMWANGSDLVVVHGGASGADQMAAEAAFYFGLLVERHPADWEKYGKAAGYRRNAEMVALGADICLAFWKNKSKGTKHTIDLCKKAGIPVEVFTDD